ncbi:putative ribosomal protein L37ae/L37e [Dioscorea sansibarensis]
MKTIGRKTTGTGRMRHLCNVPQRFQNSSDSNEEEYADGSGRSMIKPYSGVPSCYFHVIHVVKLLLHLINFLRSFEVACLSADRSILVHAFAHNLDQNQT